MTAVDHSINNFVDLVRFRAVNQGNKPVYIFLKDGESEASRLTYRELHEQATTIAQYLMLHASEGDRVLLLYPEGLDCIIGFFACLYAGMIAVPAYPPRKNQSLSRLQAIAEDSQAVLALSTQKIVRSVSQSWDTDPISSKLIWLATDEIPTNDSVHPLPVAKPDTLAFLQYTSGSTGMPKGVMVSHGNLIQNCKIIYTCFEGTPDQIGVSWLPFHHDMGLIGGVLEPLFGGGSMVFMAPVSFLQKPIRWLKAISHYRAEISGGPNFAYDLCVQAFKPEQLEGLDLSCWQLAFSGAEPVRVETLNKFADAFAPFGFKPNAFYPCYGMAETTLLVTGGERTAAPITHRFDAKSLAQNRVVPSSNPQDSKTLVGCGQTWLDQQVVIVDPESFTPSEPNTIGEIWVSGASIAQGYWKRPEVTQSTFHAYLADSEEGPYLRTGDLGFFWPDHQPNQGSNSGSGSQGELFITGRLKDVVIIRGRNHYPQDIELTVENCHPALSSNAGAAFSVEVESSEQLVLVQEVKRSHLRALTSDPAKVDEIVLAMRRAISEAHELQVYAIELLKPGSLPKTTSGKVQRRQCRLKFLDKTLTSVAQWQLDLHIQAESPGFVKSASELESLEKRRVLEEWLVNQIAQRMQISADQIDRQQPLASYGLDSMQIIAMSTDLETWLGSPVSPTIVYDYPTIQGLAHQLALDVEPNLASPTIVPQRRQDQEAIAVIGMGGRFPGAPTLDALWELLKNGNDAITEVPASRWDIDNVEPGSNIELPARWGGFLDHIDQFDPKFFGISPREASTMDPQQRLLLEICWETLENAGLSPESLAGSQSGIFLGMSNGDYSRLQGTQLTTDTYYGTGNAFSIAANRLSYVLDWHGPSFVVDTACSSSLVAIHQACQSLNSGECNLALAGGVNLILNPQLTLTFSEAQMLAADGRCKTFDASADGYVRSEGCGVVALKRLSEAQQDGDSIIAIIKGSALNQDGRSNGLTAPNSLAQQAVIRQALANAEVSADQVDYIEVHGTGTPLGDPIEINALKSVFPTPRDSDRPCWLGSVKTNMGHLEPAAGIAGLIKVLLALQQGEIPPHLHLQEVNPYIQLDGSPLKIATKLQAWPPGAQPRVAGVSSFGFGGTNAHLIVTDAPPSSISLSSSEIEPQSSSPLSEKHLTQKHTDASQSFPHLLTLSAKSEPALIALVKQYQEFLRVKPALSLADICYTATIGRSHFNQRLAIVTASRDQLLEQFQSFETGQKSAMVLQGQGSKLHPPKIAFLFTGQGSQYVDMGRQLYETQPVFRQAMDQCDQILRLYLDRPLLSIIYPSLATQNSATQNSSVSDSSDLTQSSQPSTVDFAPIDQTGYTQPALFAIEYALAQLWKSWGIRPDFVLGHSVGEYAAACIAGVISLEDGLKLIANRGRLMQALPEGGAMLSILATLAEVQDWIAPYPAEVAIAAINGPTSIVISGVETVLEQIAATLTQAEIKHKPLQVSHGFHSPLMDPMVEAFTEIAQTVSYTPPQIPFVSCLTGQRVEQDIATMDYWVRHLKAPVQFLDGITTLGAIASSPQVPPIFLEVGPKPLLLGMGRHCWGDMPVACLPSLRPEGSDWQQLLQSLGHLYVNGQQVNWAAVYGGDRYRKVVLPNYPFQRQRYWTDKPQSNQAQAFTASIKPTGQAVHPLIGLPFPSAIRQVQFQSHLSPKSPSFLTDHRVFGQVILPATAYCEIALAAGTALKNSPGRSTKFKAKATQNNPQINLQNQSSVRLTDIQFQRGLILSEQQTHTVQTILTPEENGSYHFEIFSLQAPDPDTDTSIDSDWISHAQGQINFLSPDPLDPEIAPDPIDLETYRSTLSEQISVPDYYQTLHQWGLEYGPTFQAIKQLWASPNHALGELELPESLTQDTFPYQLHPVLLDASFQILAAAIGQTQGSNPDSDQDIYLPAGIQSLQIYRPIPSMVWAKATIIEPSPQGLELDNQSALSPGARQLIAEVQLFDSSGEIIARVEGLKLAQTNRQILMRLLEPEKNPEFYETRWEQMSRSAFQDSDLEASTPTTAPSTWVIFTVHQIGQEIAELLFKQAKNALEVTETEVTETELTETELTETELTETELTETELNTPETNYILVNPGDAYHQLDDQHYQVNPTQPQDFQKLLMGLDEQGRSVQGVIHLWNLSIDDWKLDGLDPSRELETAQTLGCATVLHLVQALTRVYSRTSPHLWVITQGAQAVAENSVLHVQQSSVWGLGRVIALEHPELNCRVIDLDPEVDLITANRPEVMQEGLTQTETTQKDAILAELVQELLSPDRENQIAYRQGHRWVARLGSLESMPKTAQLSLPVEDAYQLKLKEYGLIDNLTLQGISRRHPEAKEVEIRVEAAGLNFRDVLNALGLLKEYYAEHLGIKSAAQLTFGFECAGTVVKIGNDVTHLQVGDEVMATMLMDGVSRYVTTRSEFVIAKPKSMSFEEAATLPLAFLTAYYSLVHLAKLRPGEKVLIHAAAGGVGQAAVQIAQWIGAEIYATASPTKWPFLQAQGITHVMNSRTLAFADQILAETDGQGVDVILNSLNGDYIGKSLDALATNGRLIELGKIGIWDEARVEEVRPSAQYFPFDLGDVTQENPRLIRGLFDELQQHFEAGTLKPLPHEAFAIQQGIEAFRYMQQSKHIGKVVLTMPNPSQNSALSSISINEAGSYLITGGLGALGLEVARWLVDQGAKQLILTGRRPPSDEIAGILAEIKARGVEVSVQLGDISRWADAVQMFNTMATLPPLAGVIHAAGIIDDALLAQLSWQRFSQVMAPKVAGSWNLHELTKSLSLDFFVVFSSMASLIGSPGQGNYAAANAFMDALVQYRHQLGLPGLSINWGAWAEIGMAANLDEKQQARLESRGVYPISPSKGIQALGTLLGSDRPQVGVLQMDWKKFMGQLPKGINLPLLTAYQAYSPQGLEPRSQWLDQLRQLPVPERRDFLVLQLRTQVADVLGFGAPEEVPLDETLSDLGIDSLMAVELSNQLEESIGQSIPASFLFEHPTLDDLVDFLVEQVPEIEF